MRDGLRILDADAHHVEPATLWREHLDAPFRERGPRVEEVRGRSVVVIEGEPVVRHDAFPFPEPQAPLRARDMLLRVRLAHGGARARLDDMDLHGVDVQVLLPTVGAQLLGREYRDPELLAACCTAFNRWSRHYASLAPERLLWTALLPLQDVTLACEEARRAAEAGAAGFFLRPNPVQGRGLHHRDHDPLWATLEGLGRPVCIHDSSSAQLPSYGERMDAFTAGHILSHPFEAMSAMMALLWYGVVERFPGLRILHLEADSGWLPFWLERIERHWMLSGRLEGPGGTLGPMELFERNFWVSCRGDERVLPAVVERVGDERLLFATDYPHADSTWPGGLASLEAQPLGRESRRRILWDNAAQAFGLAPRATTATRPDGRQGLSDAPLPRDGRARVASASPSRSR